MNSGATAERVFEALKRRIMAHAFRPGDRLDPAALAGDLGSSITPVRDALNRLTGEGLVDTRMGGGFHLPALDEPRLQDLYDWSAELLFLALRRWPREPSAATPAISHDPAIADHTSRLFLAIGQASSNAEHAQAIAHLNARLHAVRTVEALVLDKLDAEVTAMASALHAWNRDELRRLCNAYHRRRYRAAANIVRAVYRAS